MGWCTIDKSRNESYKDWAKRTYSFENDTIKHTVIETGLVNYGELYIACERLSKIDGLKFTYCLIVLIRKESKYRQMSKEMDETCHPYYYNCPQKVFNKLSHIRRLGVLGQSYRWTKEWRIKVAEKLA
jgi:hypothetical protein